MITAEQVETACDRIQSGTFHPDDNATLLRQLLKERDEALKIIRIRECEIDTLEECIQKARSKALDDAYDAWRYAEEKDDVGRLILSLKDLPNG